MPNNKSDYHIYSHSTPSIYTLGDFVSESNSIGVGLNIQDLMLYEDEFGNINLDNLINLYTKDELNKYKSLLNELRQKQSNKNVNSNESNNGSSTNLENSQENTLPLYSLKNELEYENVLKTPILTENQLFQSPKYFDKSGKYDLGYIYYKPTPNNQFHLSKLDSKASILFKKFIYRIETETNYNVVIQSSGRDLVSQKKQVNAGNSDSEFSYHVLGLAIDIYLQSKSDVSKITSKLPQEWIITGVKEIADEMKIRWGGNSPTFTKNGYDSVHFDLSNFYNVNKERVVKSLSGTQEQINQSINSDNTKYFDLPIKIGTILALPLHTVDRSVLSTETNQTLNSVDYKSFLAKQLVDIYSDKRYVRTFPTKIKAFSGDVKEIYPFISVWVWSRSLSISGVDNTNGTQYDHKIVNITPYIIALNTNVTENGGSFSFTLPPLMGDLTSDGNKNLKGWSVMDGTIKTPTKKDKDYIAQSHIHYSNNNELKRNRLYFDKILSNNDVVFIKFERLELEDQRGNLDELSTISVNDLPNQIFDMIGLIDDVTTETNHAVADINLTVNGRDLVKLIIEDGVYFYPTAFTSDGIFANTGATNTRLKRFGANGEYLDRFQASNKSIDKSLKFIINNLGAIEICPGNLFDGYMAAKLNITQPVSKFNTVDKRSKAYQLSDDNKDALNNQNKSLNDKKNDILAKINKIGNKNGIDNINALNVFNIIKSFLEFRKVNNQIVFTNQSIVSWTDQDSNKNLLPSELDKNFINFDRIWLIEKQKLDVAVNKLEFNAAISVIENIYSRLNKVELSETSVNSIKNLSRLENLKPNISRRFTEKISFDLFISEIDSYIKNNDSVKPVFNSNDLNAITKAYAPNKNLGKPVKLGILAKKYEDVSIDEKNIFNDIYKYILEEGGQNKKPVNPEVLPLAGIWQIIKLVVDDSVKDRRITDSSIGNENGAILNAFRKICQDPFCEFYTDTYGDQFYFIARKKPFDKESILSYIDGRVAYDQPEPVDASKVSDNESEFQGFTGVPLPNQNLIIDIDEVDVISDTLKYSTEAYSWYKLQLNNLTTGSSADMSYAYLKAVYFDEFADIYGSKPLDLSTSYIPYSPVIDKNKELPQAYFIKQGIFDLKYMIESNAHLPFTRMGSIVINGDRRIKRGTFVRLKSTSEIFYVDSVAHDFMIENKSIDRKTVLQVSRGMVERFITGVTYSIDKSSQPVDVNSKNNQDIDGQDAAVVNISYFNICNLPIDESIFNNVKSPYSAFSDGSLKQWSVNKTVFNFFLKKLQFAKNDKEISDSGLNIFQV